MKFSHRKFKKCRNRAKLSQERLMMELHGAGLTISRPTLANWENGAQRPDSNELAVIAGFFKKPLEYFFDK